MTAILNYIDKALASRGMTLKDNAVAVSL